MLAFPDMLVPFAKAAGMKVPPDPDNFRVEDYPHFAVYCTMQLGASMPQPDSHERNAILIAGIDEEKIRSITPKRLLQLGFEIGERI